MKNSMFVFAVQEGKGLASNHLFLSSPSGETIKVNKGFAMANGIDKNFGGLVQYEQITFKKDDVYTDKDGKTQKYANDGKKITSIVACTSDHLNRSEADTITRLKYNLIKVSAE